MAIDHDIDVVSDRFSHRGDAGLRALTGFRPSMGMVDGTAIDLNAVKAVRHGLLSQLRESLGVIDRRFVETLHISAAEVAVQADGIAHRTAPQLVTGNAVNLSDDVPQRDVDPGDRGRTHDSAAMPEMLSPHHLPQMFDARGIFTNQQLRQILDRSHDAARVPFQRRFTPAKQPRLIVSDFDKDPVAHPRMADKRFNRGDFHGMPLDKD